MQNSILLPPEQDYFANFVVRIVTAYKVLAAKKAIVIIDNEIDIFNMEAAEVVDVASQIIGDFTDQMFPNLEHDLAIHNLVYSN